MIPPADIAAQKAQLRRHALAARRGALAAGAAGAAVRLAALAGSMPEGEGRAVAGYWPMAGELDPRPLLLRLAGRGWRLALPVVVERDRHLDFRAWAPGDALEAGDHGTWHPPGTAPLVVPALVLMPMLAFDRRGFRLGYGGGYYDRTLESLRDGAHLTTMGVAFAAQEVPAVPHDGHDQRLDWIATEQGLIEVGPE